MNLMKTFAFIFTIFFIIGFSYSLGHRLFESWIGGIITVGLILPFLPKLIRKIKKYLDDTI